MATTSNLNMIPEKDHKVQTERDLQMYAQIHNFFSQTGVTVETAYRLDDDSWHSVLVEKNRKEAMVVIDGARKGQVQEPRGPVRPMLLESGLFVGATRDFSDG